MDVVMFILESNSILIYFKYLSDLNEYSYNKIFQKTTKSCDCQQRARAKAWEYVSSACFNTSQYLLFFNSI